MFVLCACEMTGDFSVATSKWPESSGDSGPHGRRDRSNCGVQLWSPGGAAHTPSRQLVSSGNFFIYQNKGWEGGVTVTVDDATGSELQCRIIELEGDGKPTKELMLSRCVAG